MADIISFELRAHVVSLEFRAIDFHVAERISEYEVLGALSVCLLPIIVVALRLIAAGHRVNREIHAAEIEGCQFRCVAWDHAQTVLRRHSHTAARRDSDRKSTRLNSSHLGISYAVFCLKK